MTTDPRVEAAEKAFWTEPNVAKEMQAALEAADAVMFSEEAVWRIALEMARHHRIGAMTGADRCTCGCKTELGKLFHEHVARAVVTALRGGA